MISLVKVWNLPPGEFNRVLQNPGMDLGKPDRVYQPESVLGIAHSPQDTARRRKGGKSPASITREQYKELRAKGLSKDQICERLNIHRSTLLKYIKMWQA